MLDVIKKAKRNALMYANPDWCKPVSARLVVTINCNFHCQTCTFDWPYWTPEMKKDPSLEQVKHWISEMADFGVKEIEIGGGEVTLRRDLPDMINAVHEAGMKCGITTNGWLIGGGQVPFPKVDSMEISIDGAKAETHDKIRKIKGSFDRAIKTLEMAKKQCLVHLNFVVQSDNYLEMVDYCNLARKLGVRASFIPVSLDLAAQPHMPESLTQFDIPLLKQQVQEVMKTGVALNSPASLKNFFDRKEKGKPSPQKCLAPYRCILIFNNSDVYPCGNFDMPVGNLSLDKKLKDIWRNYQNIRSEVRSGKHDFCNNCTYGDVSTRKTILTSVVPYLKRRFLKSI